MVSHLPARAATVRCGICERRADRATIGHRPGCSVRRPVSIHTPTGSTRARPAIHEHAGLHLAALSRRLADAAGAGHAVVLPRARGARRAFRRGKNLPPEIEANLAAKYHLDEPLWQQYLRYLGDLARGDLGPSFKYADYTVNELIAQGFPVSLRLGLAAMAVALLIGLPAGMLAALRQNRPLDHLSMAAAMTGISVPGFVVAPLLILVFAVHLGWLPAGRLDGGLRAWVLPVTALALPLLAYIARLTRASLIEVWRSPSSARRAPRACRWG